MNAAGPLTTGEAPAVAHASYPSAMAQDGYLLLVEDNPGDARLTRTLLADGVPPDAPLDAPRGAPDAPVVVWATTIAQALQQMAAVPDCRAVLLDLALPDSHGLAGLQALLAVVSDCPVIVLTGDASAALGAQAVAAGAQDFLVKGAFDGVQLRRCIGFAAQRQRLQRRELDRQHQAALADARAARDLLRDALAQQRTTSQRVAQALHDQLGQTLAVARLNLDACLTRHAAALPGDLTAQLEQLAQGLSHAVREVREVLVDLRPPGLEADGLTAALANEVQAHRQARLDVRLAVADGLAVQRWPDEVEYAVFMVAREAVANALLHGGGSRVHVLLDGAAGRLQLDVVDDGIGIPPSLRGGRPGHLGLVGMRERCLAIGASFALAAEPAGGTRVTLRWPAAGP